MASPPLILAIETSNPSAWEEHHPAGPGVAVAASAAPGVPLATAFIDPRITHDDRLVAEIDRCVTAVANPRPRLERVAVSVGPGGYTTVRLAVTVTKMIAEVTGAQCVPVPTALVAVAQYCATNPAAAEQPIAVALASKGDSAWVSVVHRGAILFEGLISNPDAVSRFAPVFLLADRFLPAGLRALAPRLEPLILSPLGCLLASVGRESVDPLALGPIYPREPEAVSKWRQLHGPA